MAINVVPDIAIGGTGTLVIILLYLHSKGIIDLPIKQVKNSKNNSRGVCPAHENVVKVQTEHTTVLTQVKDELKKGSDKFDKVNGKIDKLSIDVGVLLDRTK